MRDAIAACRFYVREEVNYDNWNGGTWGHDVLFFLPLEELAKIDIEEQRDIASGVCQLLNKMAEMVEGEWFNAVSFEMIDESDAECQKAQAFSQTAPINPDTVSFWKPGLARVFISHRDGHKVQARDLSSALEEYGISCFVAHDTIQPMSEWRTEIMKGLQTMEVMLVFLTDDFSESMWCHQEVGFALGKGVPIVSLKLGQKDPPGFISHVQAQRGKIDSPSQSATDLFPLIGKALGRQDRLHEILIGSFVAAPTYIDAKARFERMADSVEKLTEAQCERIIAAFRANDQLHNSMYLINRNNRLKKFLERGTGREFEINGREIKELKEDADLDDVPF
ncbi:toll/interleukin-1 receptor domain-containing protein [Sphingobium abikonense]|uniref:toll/interleukin-1 receptor domain-containing protein n=1 Tax=Sphingobium abikonense TaxID=86193 RepID=UPI003519C22E